MVCMPGLGRVRSGGEHTLTFLTAPPPPTPWMRGYECHDDAVQALPCCSWLTGLCSGTQ
jgi:hypothetical protein